MAEREKGSPRGVLLVGAGPLARQAGAVLATLSALDPTGEKRLEPWRELGVADLEELLSERPLEGLLILESGRVPSEDIGFVRRFLERHPGWRLAVFGEDKNAARALLQLERARWLAWPPDLAELRSLLERSAAAPAAPTAPAPAPAGEGGERAPRRGPRRAAISPNGGIELGRMLEELLAGAALQGEGAPRFTFRGEPTLVHHERAALREAFAGLVDLARMCAGSTGLVRAELDPNGDAVVVGLDFPRGGLPEKDLPTLLGEEAAPELEPGLAEGLAVARRAAELVQELGGQVELSTPEPGRVRCEVRLAAGAPGPARSGRGKPEDPFA